MFLQRRLTPRRPTRSVGAYAEPDGLRDRRAAARGGGAHRGASGLGEQAARRGAERQGGAHAPVRARGRDGHPPRRARQRVRGARGAPPPPRTKWTRRVPHPVLIGHSSSPSLPSLSLPPTLPPRHRFPRRLSQSRRNDTPCWGHVAPTREGETCSSFDTPSCPLLSKEASRAPPRARRRRGRSATRCRRSSCSGSATRRVPPPSLPYKVDTSRPSLRTNWTCLVPPAAPSPSLAPSVEPFSP